MHWGNLRYIYWHSSLISSHELFLYVAHIWHLRSMPVVNMCIAIAWWRDVALCFFITCMCSLYVHHSSSEVGQICTMWQAYLVRGICQYSEISVHQCSYSQCWLQWVHMGYLLHSCAICTHELISFCHTENHIFPGQYQAIMCEVYIVVGSVLAYIFKNTGSICHVPYWLCGSQLQCESHICSFTSCMHTVTWQKAWYTCLHTCIHIAMHVWLHTYIPNCIKHVCMHSYI